MTVKPLLMSGPMVQATFDERKTQTRRLLKPQPQDTRAKGKPVIEVDNYSTGLPQRGLAYYWRENGCWNSSEAFHLPYAVGDLLWVRETWNLFVCSQDGECSWPAKSIPTLRPDDGPRHRQVVDFPVAGQPGYDGGKGPWRPSIHMPRWASRLTLEVTDVRVERLQDISEEDAKAEGVEPTLFLAEMVGGSPEKFRRSFRLLWDSLNKKPGTTWADNPWVVAITFQPHQCNVDDLSARRAAA